MKLRKFLSMGVLSVLALGACTPNADDNSEWNDGTKPVSFTSSIQGVKSRATNSTWDENGNDEIGVFTKKNSVFDAANKHYGVSAAGVLTTKSANDAIYYPTDGTKVDFVAYYPYAATLANNSYAVNLSDQSVQSKIDLLYSTNATQKDNTVSTPVQLTFTHQLTKVVLNITRDATVPTLAGLQVGISGTNRKATFDLLNGQLANPTDMADIAAKVKEDGSLAEAIILPTNGLNGGKISFTLNGKIKTWDIPAGQNYAAGSQYTYPVTIKETGGQISVTFGAAAITNWTPVTGGNIDIDFAGGGTVDPEPDPDPTPGGEVKTIFEETFGSVSVGSAKKKIEEYTEWDNKNLTFTDEYGTWADVRTTSTMINAVWFPASVPTGTPSDKSSSLKIAGINTQGYTNLKLTYDIATQTANSNQNVIKVKCGTQAMTVPSAVMEKFNQYYPVEITGIPDGITTIEFISDLSNTIGYRIDNIKLEGTTK